MQLSPQIFLASQPSLVELPDRGRTILACQNPLVPFFRSAKISGTTFSKAVQVKGWVLVLSRVRSVSRDDLWKKRDALHAPTRCWGTLVLKRENKCVCVCVSVPYIHTMCNTKRMARGEDIRTSVCGGCGDDQHGRMRPFFVSFSFLPELPPTYGMV